MAKTIRIDYDLGSVGSRMHLIIATGLSETKGRFRTALKEANRQCDRLNQGKLKPGTKYIVTVCGD